MLKLPDATKFLVLVECRLDSVAGTDRDYRDYKLGQDAVAGAKKEIAAELLRALTTAGWLVEPKRLSEKRKTSQTMHCS